MASGVLVVGVAVLAALTPSAAAAGAAHSRPSIVCPGVANPPTCCPPPVIATSVRPDAVTCCPVPTIAGCCGPASGTTCCATTTCPQGLTIVVNPSPVREGSKTTIGGTLSGTTVSGQNIDLYEKPAGQSTFSDVAQTQTSSSGTYQFVRALQTNAQWYATAASIQSPTVSETVLAAVRLHPSSVHPKAGAKVMFSGTVAPSHAGERVALQRLESGRWKTVARPKLSATSGFAIAEKMRGRTRARFRVVLAADARNALSVSGTVAVKAH